MKRLNTQVQIYYFNDELCEQFLVYYSNASPVCEIENSKSISGSANRNLQILSINAGYEKEMRKTITLNCVQTFKNLINSEYNKMVNILKINSKTGRNNFFMLSGSVSWIKRRKRWDGDIVAENFFNNKTPLQLILWFDNYDGNEHREYPALTAVQGLRADVICYNSTAKDLKSIQSMDEFDVVAVIYRKPRESENSFKRKANEQNLKTIAISDTHYFNKFSKLIPCDFDSAWEDLDMKVLKEETEYFCNTDIAFILDRFKNVPATPRNKSTYQKIYVFPEEISPHLRITPEYLKKLANTQRGNKKILNTPDVQGDVLNYFLTITKSNCARNKTTAQVLTGARGVGKTAYISYLTSCYDELFNQEKVIYIKVDLTDINAIDHSIQDLLNVKTYDIIVKWYLDGGIEPISMFPEGVKGARKRELSLEADDGFIDYFCPKQKGNELEDNFYTSLISYKTVDERDCILRLDLTIREKIRRVIRYREFLKYKKYSFLYIIDGLDEATSTLQKKRKLDDWKVEIVNILQDKGNFPPGLYLLSARIESFKNIGPSLSSNSIPKDPLIEWEIMGVSFVKVVRARFSWLDSLITNKGGSEDKNLWIWPNDTGRILEGIVYQIITYAFSKVNIDFNFLEKISKTGHMRSLLNFYRDAIHETIAIIEEWSNNDLYFNRLRFNIQKVILSILDNNEYIIQKINDLLEKKAYRIWNITPLILEPEKKRNYDIIRENPSNSFYSTSYTEDFPLIPILWGNIYNNNKEGYFNNCLLSKIRILQFLSIQEDMSMKYNDLVKMITGMFQYPRLKVNDTVHMMYLERLINYKIEEDLFSPLELSTVYITELGQITLNNLLYVPEYFEATMHLSTIPDTVTNYFNRVIVQRLFGPLAQHTNISLDAYNYVPRITKNLNKFIALVGTIEKWEYTRFLLYKNAEYNKRRFNRQIDEFEKKFFNLYSSFRDMYIRRVDAILIHLGESSQMLKYFIKEFETFN